MWEEPGNEGALTGLQREGEGKSLTPSPVVLPTAHDAMLATMGTLEVSIP